MSDDLQDREVPYAMMCYSWSETYPGLLGISHLREVSTYFSRSPVPLTVTHEAEFLSSK